MQKPSIVTTAANQAILDLVVKNKFKGIDDHKSSAHHLDKSITLGGVGVYERDGKQCVVALFTGSYSSYYCVNRINVIDDEFHITRDNCAGLVTDASNDINADLDRMWSQISWSTVEKYPSLMPGVIGNVVVAA
jgi:hypothetical protein